MPRAFSSGALSIESNARTWIFGLCLAKTFVIAAVRVVLPWSMCPIVPMLTCGLLRSNFFLLILFLEIVLSPAFRRPHVHVEPPKGGTQNASYLLPLPLQ